MFIILKCFEKTPNKQSYINTTHVLVNFLQKIFYHHGYTKTKSYFISKVVRINRTMIVL